MGPRFQDFDAAFAERDATRTPATAEPVTIRLYGRRWNLGHSMPAAAALRMSRLAADRDLADVDLSDPAIVGEVMTLAADMIPAPTLNTWLDRGIEVDDLGEILLWVFGQHIARNTDDTGGDSGEAEAPEAGASTSSSNDGASSKPTSTASTSSSSPGT